MGKATIGSHIADGEYSATLKLKRDRYDSKVAVLNAKITDYQTRAAAMDDGKQKDILNLRIASCQKMLTAMANLMDADPTQNAWCADLTTDLSGDVGTIEVPGERVGVNIRPGYQGAAVYSASRDGQVEPGIAGTPAGTFYNYAMMPGWQKFKPTYRYGTITAIDIGANTCSVTLDAVNSSIRSININQGLSLVDVPVDYMTCNAAAFEINDKVIVEFTGQDFESPKVIGFKTDPQKCTAYVVFKAWVSGFPAHYVVWDAAAADFADLSGWGGPSGAGGYPCEWSDIQTWYNTTSAESKNAIYDTTTIPPVAYCDVGTFVSPSTGCGPLEFGADAEYAWDYTPAPDGTEKVWEACAPDATGFVYWSYRERECTDEAFSSPYDANPTPNEAVGISWDLEVVDAVKPAVAGSYTSCYRLVHVRDDYEEAAYIDQECRDEGNNLIDYTPYTSMFGDQIYTKTWNRYTPIGWMDEIEYSVSLEGHASIGFRQIWSVCDDEPGEPDTWKRRVMIITEDFHNESFIYDLYNSEEDYRWDYPLPNTYIFYTSNVMVQCYFRHRGLTRLEQPQCGGEQPLVELDGYPTRVADVAVAIDYDGDFAININPLAQSRRTALEAKLETMMNDAGLETGPPHWYETFDAASTYPFLVLNYSCIDSFTVEVRL